jgi:hypothetical protein
MQNRLKTARRLGWIVLGGGLVFQAGGCAGNLLFQAIGFEVSNLLAGLTFSFTQTVVENFLDI